MEESQLTKALAAVQAQLPKVDKGKTASVPTKSGGSYSYSYADLSSVTDALLPVLAKNGLAWVAMPTLIDAGFVLHYELRHESGEVLDGYYPLGSPNGRPQDSGSAITYARRYALCSVVGLVPDEDDDGQGAEQAYTRSQQQRRQGNRSEPKLAGNDGLWHRIGALGEAGVGIRKKIDAANFPNPWPAGAVKQVEKWVTEAEAGAPF